MPSYPRRTTLPPDTPSFGERYDLVRKLGTGGMGAVYQAVDSALEKNVAVKILLPGLSSEAVIRFQQEAKATARLDHPNIVQVLDFGQTPSGDLFLIMDYVGKHSLEDLIKRDKRISIEKALPIFIQIASGLSHAHKNGILHRDVKPSNIMLSEKQDGNVQLVDFGLAKLESDDSQKLTTTGIHVGSPLYMSPEQVIGIDVDVRSDIYSLGCLMFKTLTGKPPLQGKTSIDTIIMQRDQIPPFLSETKCGLEFSPEIEDIVAKTLEKDPADRFQSAQELKQALEGLQEVHKARMALAASFSHDFEELPSAFIKQKSSIELALEWSRTALVGHRKVVLVSAIILVSAGYYMHYQYEKMTAARTSESKLSESNVPELMNNASAEIIEKGRAPGKLNKNFGKAFGEASRPSLWDQIPQYTKANARQMMDEVQSTPSLKQFARDPEFRRGILSGKLHRLWHDHSMSGLMHSKLMEEMLPEMQGVWNDPKFKSAWSDAVVQEFLRTPKLWHLSTNELKSANSKFADNENLRLLMSDKRFLNLLGMPKFVTLMKDKRFQILLSEPVNMKMLQCMEAYRDQMKNDVAEMICPLQDDLNDSKSKSGF